MTKNHQMNAYDKRMSERGKKLASKNHKKRVDARLAAKKAAERDAINPPVAVEGKMSKHQKNLLSGEGKKVKKSRKEKSNEEGQD